MAESSGLSQLDTLTSRPWGMKESLQSLFLRQKGGKGSVVSKPGAQLAQPGCQPPSPAPGAAPRGCRARAGQKNAAWAGRTLMGWHKPGPGQGFAELSFELCLFCLGLDNVQKPALISLGLYNSTLNDSRDASSYR